jgi:hypothetical protein
LTQLFDLVDPPELPWKGGDCALIPKGSFLPFEPCSMCSIPQDFMQPNGRAGARLSNAILAESARADVEEAWLRAVPFACGDGFVFLVIAAAGLGLTVGLGGAFAAGLSLGVRSAVLTRFIVPVAA